MAEIRPEEYKERNDTVEGWPIGIVSYRLGDRWIAKIHNVSPGAVIARGEGRSRAEAEGSALARARTRLASTRRMRDAVQDLKQSVKQLDGTLRTSIKPDGGRDRS